MLQTEAGAPFAPRRHSASLDAAHRPGGEGTASDSKRRRWPKSRNCPRCGVTCASLAQLRVHEHTVHALPAARGHHACTVCGKTFLELRYLRQHMEKHGEERFVCANCGQRSRWASAMIRHRKKCTEVRPQVVRPAVWNE